jgi:hypothetical protein
LCNSIRVVAHKGEFDSFYFKIPLFSQAN